MGHSSISTAGASFFSKRKEDAGTRLPPVEGCGTYTRLLPIRILYLPRRSLAMPRTSHLTANTPPTDPRSYSDTASRLLPPRAAGNAHTEPANLVPPVGRERAVLPVLPRPLPQTLSLTQPLSQSPSQGGGVHGLRVHADKLTRPAVILQSFRHSFMAGQPLIRWPRLARAWGRLEASYVMYCSHALRVSSGAL